MTSRAARAAHELRTPLHGILGAAELLRAGALDDAQRAHVATIEEAARALLRVADDAVAAAADPGAALDAVAAPCDVRALVDGVCRLLEPAARARGLALTAVVHDGVPARVATDAGRVRQLLVNLAGNAIKFAGEGAVALALRTADGGKALALEVRDAGPGLPEEALAALAMPAHRRTDARPSAPGTRPGGGAGLGLSIVAELVDALGGALRVESGAAGTTFRITLPAPAVGGADADAAAHDDAVRAGTRVLVVDDDPVSRRVTAALLESLGCEVDVAGDGAAALALAGRGAAYELVMLDVQLADGDGCALAAALRERETASGSGLAATPLVALTAHADAAVRARCAAAGFAECLAKPVGRAGLAAAVARWAARPAAALPIAALPDARDVPDVLDVLDAEAVARLRDLEGYAPGLLAAVAADYAATSVRRLGEIDRAAARGDRAAVERAAHALKGASASAGATRAAECATAVMLGAAGGRADGTAGGWVDGAAIARLRGEVERAAAALASLLD